MRVSSIAALFFGRSRETAPFIFPAPARIAPSRWTVSPIIRPRITERITAGSVLTLPRYVTPIAMEDTPNTSVRSFLSFSGRRLPSCPPSRPPRKTEPTSIRTPTGIAYFFFIMVRFMISLTRALSTTVATVAGMYTVQKE